MLQDIINRISLSPKIFIFLRKILENNFKNQKHVIERYFSPESDKAILDLGCGTGEFSVFFNPLTYTGIDIEQDYIDFARRTYKGTFLVENATSLSFEESSFDGIVILGVLHHIDDENCHKIMKELKRVLKPSGTILVIEDVDSPEDNFLTEFIHNYDKGGYIRTKEEYSSLLTSEFRIVASYHIKSGLCPYQVFSLENKK